MLTKTQKRDFVSEHKKALKSYKAVGVVQLSGVPDRLLQRVKNDMRANTIFIMGRKSLLSKILESDDVMKVLADSLTSTSAIVLSNDDPFELYGKFKSSSIRLGAKPGQAAPDDIFVSAGETSVQPGQTVTELKNAGIDVKIDKGKVVISKDKVLVKKGDIVTVPVAKALHTLDIFPFSASIDPVSIISNGILFGRKALGITRESTELDISRSFRSALAICVKTGIVNSYTINSLLAKAYNSAMFLGVEAKMLDSGIVDRLLARAALQAAALGAKVKPEVGQ